MTRWSPSASMGRWSPGARLEQWGMVYEARLAVVAVDVLPSCMRDPPAPVERHLTAEGIEP